MQSKLRFVQQSKPLAPKKQITYKFDKEKIKSFPPRINKNIYNQEPFNYQYVNKQEPLRFEDSYNKTKEELNDQYQVLNVSQKLHQQLMKLEKKRIKKAEESLPTLK
ncbi:Hypothetical_protein [Hexamita inflata]|uniref:Hypothetical_protein n=1 Tax=Hexamita inflata TaxID=28002 RepID=A0AA86P3I7_9EUKA|nr:Hypothetical protein HINF_LOCUS18859 [Hexamita inflata]